MNKMPISRNQLVDLARQAGALMKGRFNPFGVPVTWKNGLDRTPLTETDTAINLLIIDFVKKNCPQVSVKGEEQDYLAEGEWELIVDPIDGTFNFMNGIPLSTIMMCLVCAGVPMLSVIYQPQQDMMWVAERGKGSTCNGHSIVVSNPTPEMRITIACDISPGRDNYLIPVVAKLQQAGIAVISQMGIGYGTALVALGRLHGTIMPGFDAHDTAPGHLLVEEAGGTATDLYGGELRYPKGGKVRGHIFASSQLHPRLLEAVRQVLV